MTCNNSIRLIALALLGAGLACGGYWIGSRNGHAADAGPVAQADKIDPETGRKVLYWHDPMVPNNKFDKPGKSPFMEMQLVPVFADPAPDAGGVTISPALRQNLGVRFTSVRRQAGGDSFDLLGSTQFDESLVQVLQSRATGYIDKLYVRAPMQAVRKGEPLASLYVPEWIAAQEEYLALKRSGDSELAGAARQRMRVLSIPDSLVARADSSGRAQTHLLLVAPAAGVLTELPLREGAMVAPGMTVARIAGLKQLWLVAELPESLAGQVRPGMPVTAGVSGTADSKYAGVVREILPGVNPATRTIQARLALDNRDAGLTPGMLMRVRIDTGNAVSRLLVASEAVIVNGKGATVLVAGAENSIQPVAVAVGRSFGDDTEILSGLSEGQQVVASGQFLIDSEASLKSVLPKFGGQPAAAPMPAMDHSQHAAHAGHDTTAAGEGK